MTVASANTFGFSGRNSEQPAIVMTSLVDIMLATIGIFVIVFALQEISRPSERVPAPFEGAILCDVHGDYSFYGLDGRSYPLKRSDLVASLMAMQPNGGRFLVGIAPGCASVRIDKRSRASDLAYAMRRKLGLQNTPSGEPLHQFEIAPLGKDSCSFDTLLERILPSTQNRDSKHARE